MSFSQKSLNFQKHVALLELFWLSFLLYSTIVKQMRLNYGQPFADEERFGYREVMAANALQR